jgi:hypothetical protein
VDTEEEDEEDTPGELKESLLAADIEVDSFSNSNLVLIHKLEFIDSRLKEIHKQMTSGKWEPNFSTFIYIILSYIL